MSTESINAPEAPTTVWHEVDGIIEHDNKLPRWWLFTFFAAIVFAIVYWLVYHTVGALPLLNESYEREVADHEARVAAAMAARPLDDTTLAAGATDPAMVARGQQTFSTICAACHGQNGEGLVGPNLTDSSWIHGGTPMALYQIVTVGVATKGMPAWAATLGDSGTKDIVAYLLTLKGKNLPGKAPQGTPE